MTANDELLPRKHYAIVNNIREFLDFMCNDKRLTSSIVPIGDGMLISVKKEENQ